jgi:hypothetical protein
MTAEFLVPQGLFIENRGLYGDDYLARDEMGNFSVPFSASCKSVWLSDLDILAGVSYYHAGILTLPDVHGNAFREKFQVT